MNILRTSFAGRAVAAVLVFVLMLSGVGRGLAGASGASGQPGAFPICHAGAGGGAMPGRPQPRDCCEACALLAPALAAGPPPLAAPPARTALMAAMVTAAAWPSLARPRTPRQSQGPPAA